MQMQSKLKKVRHMLQNKLKEKARALLEKLTIHQPINHALAWTRLSFTWHDIAVGVIYFSMAMIKCLNIL